MTQHDRQRAIPVLESLPVGRRRSIGEAEMDITPMIDITFLLLIFFLVAARMASTADLELPKAEYATSVVAQNAIIITVAELSRQTVLYRGQGKESQQRINHGPNEMADAIRDYIESESAARPSSHHVVLMAERNVRHRVVADIARDVADATSLPLYVAVLEETK